jgi:hypothetical protein
VQWSIVAAAVVRNPISLMAEKIAVAYLNDSSGRGGGTRRNRTRVVPITQPPALTARRSSLLRERLNTPRPVGLARGAGEPEP